MNKRALVTLAAFGGLALVYILSEQAPGGGVGDAPAWEIPALKGSTDRIEVVRAGVTVVLELKDGAWMIAGDKAHVAAKGQVDGLLGLFEGPVGVDLKVPVSADEFGRYELDDEKGIRATFGAGGKTLASFMVGKSVGKRTFVRPLQGEAGPVVYRAKARIKWKLDHEPSAWREKKVFAIERGDVAGLTLHHPAGAADGGGPISLALESEGEGDAKTWKDTWRIVAPVQEGADKSTASSLLGGIINLRVAEFADDVPVAEAGFGEASFKVTMRMKPGKGDPQTLIFGGPVGGGRFEGKYADDLFAMREGAQGVFVVRKYTRDNAAKTLEELRNKAVFEGMKREDITGLVLERAAGTLRFAKEGDHWKVAAPEALKGKLDESPLNTLLSSLANLRASRVITQVPDATGGFTPDARTVRVTLTTPDRGDVILLVGGLADEAKKEWYARLEDAPTPVWVLRDYVIRQMTKSAAGFKKKDKA